MKIIFVFFIAFLSVGCSMEDGVVRWPAAVTSAPTLEVDGQVEPQTEATKTGEDLGAGLATCICMFGVPSLLVAGTVYAWKRRRKSRRDASRIDPVVAWAKELLADPDNLAVVDTETTGVSHNDEVIQIAVVDGHGRTLIDTLVRPLDRKRMPPGAFKVHGISMKDLADAPTWVELHETLSEVFRGKRVVAYNAEFDARLMRQTAEKYGVVLPLTNIECAMLALAQYIGEPSPKFAGQWKWHRLPGGGSHVAIDDARAALQVVRDITERRHVSPG